MARKRYNLVLPEAQFDEVKRVAERNCVTVAEMLRKFIRFGLFVVQNEGKLFVREGDIEREIILL